MNNLTEHWDALHKLWTRSRVRYQHAGTTAENNAWHAQQLALNVLGISQEEALRFLYHEQPDEEVFRNWLIEKSQKPVQSTQPSVAEDEVLGEADLEFWNENGYIVLKEAVPRHQCLAAQEAIWEFIQADPDDSASWYRLHEQQRGLMLLFSDHPVLNVNRDSPRIKRAYEQLYQTKDIYRVVDKVSFNPPENGRYRFAGSRLHWDVSLAFPIPTEFQGLLYLTDCDEHEGAFHCVPGFHREIESWIGSLPDGAEPRNLAPELLKPVPVPGKAGDFVIWHQALPHCATPNRGTTPRMVQYLTWLPKERKIMGQWK